MLLFDANGVATYSSVTSKYRGAAVRFLIEGRQHSLRMDAWLKLASAPRGQGIDYGNGDIQQPELHGQLTSTMIPVIQTQESQQPGSGHREDFVSPRREPPTRAGGFWRQAFKVFRSGPIRPRPGRPGSPPARSGREDQRTSPSDLGLEYLLRNPWYAV